MLKGLKAMKLLVQTTLEHVLRMLKGLEAMKLLCENHSGACIKNAERSRSNERTRELKTNIVSSTHYIRERHHQ